VVVAAIVAIAISSVWFGPRTFFPIWWKAMGRSENEKPGGENMLIVFASTFVAQFVMAFAVAIVVAMQASRGSGTLGAFDGLFIGLLVGVGFAAAASVLGHRLFAGQSFKVWLIEVGADVLCLTVMSVIIALWR
jgi:hypothetical protein